MNKLEKERDDTMNPYSVDERYRFPLQRLEVYNSCLLNCCYCYNVDVVRAKKQLGQIICCSPPPIVAFLSLNLYMFH